MPRDESVTNEDVADLIREIKEEVYVPEEEDFIDYGNKHLPDEDELYDDELDADEWFERAENEDYIAQFE